MDFVEEERQGQSVEAGEDSVEMTAEELKTVDGNETTKTSEESIGDKLKSKLKKKDKNADDELKKELAEEKDRYVRLNAEFQNYKKRVEREKTDLVKFANERLLSDFLTVLDNMDRALENSADSPDDKLREGLVMIEKSLKDLLEKNGVEEVEAKGEEFDPELHHAVMTEEVEGTDEGIVLDVLQKGYKLKGKVIRPAMVKVSK